MARSAFEPVSAPPIGEAMAILFGKPDLPEGLVSWPPPGAWAAYPA